MLELDEVDKAPVEVVVVLKALLEDGEMTLSDGRVVLSPARYDKHVASVRPRAVKPASDGLGGLLWALQGSVDKPLRCKRKWGAPSLVNGTPSLVILAARAWQGKGRGQARPVLPKRLGGCAGEASPPCNK